VVGTCVHNIVNLQATHATSVSEWAYNRAAVHRNCKEYMSRIALHSKK
jgi:hypothetical protein